MRLFYLDVRKTVQAIGVLLTSVGRKNLEYLTLIKLLYIADRESWKETGTSITGDAPCAMKNGPVLSGVYDLVNLNSEQDLGYWTEFIHKEEYDLVLKADPGQGLLSSYEVQKLSEIANRHKSDDWRALIRITHDLPEWKWNDPTESGYKMSPIPLDDILKAVGRAEDAEYIKREAEDAIKLRQAFGR